MNVGLCATCKHSRTVKGARTTFWMCQLSRTDPSFPQYPRLPILQCRGYEPVVPRPGDVGSVESAD